MNGMEASSTPFKGLLMTGTAFESLREAIHHTATASGVPMKSLAADLDFSPSNLSMRTTLGEDGLPFPADERLVRLQRITGDLSVLLTMAAKLGCEVHPKRDHLPEILTDIQRTQQELSRKIQQLELTVPISAGTGKRSR